MFIYNALDLLARLGQKEIASSIRPGQSVRFRLGDNVDRLTVVSPTGNKQELRPQGDGSFLVTAVDELGIHRIVDGEQRHMRSIAVSLSDRRESDIAVREQTRIGNTAVEPTVGATRVAANPLWRYLLLMALLVLFVEWIVYNRRILL
jgi:hypothetical protein